MNNLEASRRITKKVTTYDKDPQKFYSYEAQVGPQKFNVWFKFGCAHITNVKPKGEPEDLNPQEYLHVCEPAEFAEFLLAAINMSNKEGNSWEQ